MEQAEKKEVKAEKNKLKFVGANNGFSIKKNGLVDLKIECDATQLAKVLMILQYANEEFSVGAKTPDGNVVLGKFMFKSLSIDRDGETKLTLQADKNCVILSAVEMVYQLEELVTFVLCQRINSVV